jgi:GNAT superfamily N-acetyltransferase
MTDLEQVSARGSPAHGQGAIVVRKLTSADVHTTAEVLAHAFADNPAYVWMHPRAVTRAGDLRAFFERNLRWHQPLELTWVATRGPTIVGTNTLEPPGGVRSGTREATAHWLVPTVRDQGPRTFLRTAAAGREFGERYRALINGTQYYHIHAVAVAPDFQGNGVGRLLAATLQECERLLARDSAPVVLSTQRERTFHSINAPDSCSRRTTRWAFAGEAAAFGRGSCCENHDGLPQAPLGPHNLQVKRIVHGEIGNGDEHRACGDRACMEHGADDSNMKAPLVRPRTSPLAWPPRRSRA